MRVRQYGNRGRRGASLLVAVLFMMMLGGMAAALVSLNATFHKEHILNREDARSFYAAEAGINEAFAVLQEQGEGQLMALAYPQTLGSTTYSVEVVDGQVDPNLRSDRIRLRSVGDGGQGPAGVELMIQRKPTGFFQWAIFSQEQTTIQANTVVDSFDSNAGPYPGAALANNAGNVGSNDDITLDANSTVKGDVIAGPTGTIDDSASGITVTGEVGMLPNAVSFPPVTVPAIADLGPLSVSGSTALPAGDYHYSSLVVNGGGTFTLQGPARLVVDSLDVNDLGTLQLDATGGPIEIYGTGGFSMSEDAVISTICTHARDISIELTSDNLGGGDSVYFDADGSYIGTIYAPNAFVELDNEFIVHGAVKAKRVLLENPNFPGALHYDEDLMYDPLAAPEFERASWRQLSEAELRDLGF